MEGAEFLNERLPKAATANTVPQREEKGLERHWVPSPILPLLESAYSIKHMEVYLKLIKNIFISWCRRQGKCRAENLDLLLDSL